MKSIFTLIFIFFYTCSFSQGTWTHTGNLSQSNSDNVYAMTSGSSGEFFASSWAVGIFKSTDNGNNWNLSGLAGKRVTTLRTAPNGSIYALSKTVSISYIHRSTDNGSTWTDVDVRSFPLNYAGGGEIIFPSDGSVIAAYAVTVGPTVGDVATFVFKSTDNGDSWTQIQRIVSGFVGGMIITEDNKILLGTSLGGVKYSTNNGANFSSLTSFPPVFIAAILKAPDNTIYVSDAFGLNRSNDNGNSFTNVGVLNNTSYLGEAGVSSNGELFVTMDDDNTYFSDDKGENWSVINTGLPATGYIKSFYSYQGKMYAGTSNSGIYFYDVLTSENSNIENVNDFILHQNYPNPFNPSTKINYELRVTNYVSLKVFDVLGNEITSLVEAKQNPGTYEVEFKGENLPSGVYFYKLESGETLL
jgi:photosystem II stability/assembly factor-like uncharacterized protein